MTLYCATTNEHKIAEFQLAFSMYGQGRYEVRPLPRMKSIQPCVETGNSFLSIATQKAAYYSLFHDGYVFVDDSGLQVDALQGAPGIFSARFASVGATSEQNNTLLLEKLAGVKERQASFVCALGLAVHRNVCSTFTGTVSGEILEAPRGGAGFGYDPLFLYPPQQLTFAELPAKSKAMISHRGRAVQQIVNYLNQKRSGPS